MSSIIKRNAYDIYKQDYSDYAVNIVRSRVLPSVKDGLKIVTRRTLWAAYKQSKAFGYRKSATVVGDTLGHFHPHGDSSVYDNLKQIITPWTSYVPLMDGHGNWGNVQGDSQAAMRYTETKISDFSMNCVLKIISEVPDSVDWIPTYDNSDKEPEYFPVLVPLLLIRGSFGIAVGLKVEIPPHNINEVIDATLKLIDHPNANITLIPDQCQECDIVETDFDTISATGRGKIIVRGKMEPIESITKDLLPNREYIGKPGILVTSTPDGAYWNNIVEKISKLKDDNTLSQVISVEEPENEDKKDNADLYAVIVLKKGADINFIIDTIYKKTEMQKTISENFMVLDDNYNPLRLGHKGYLQAFLEYNKMYKFRYYANLYQKVKTKIHEKEPFVKLLDSGKIDEVREAIIKKNTTDDNVLIEYLIKTLDITDLQAKFIINIQIKKLNKAYLQRFKDESNELKKEAQFYFDRLNNENLLNDEIKEELKEIKKRFGKPRNCRIISAQEINNIPKGKFKIVVTMNNQIKKVPEGATFGSLKGEKPKFVMTVENDKNLFIFDEIGKVYKLPIYKIPISDNTSPFVDIRLILKNLGGDIISIYYEPTFNDILKLKVKHFLCIQTKKCLIKKIDIEDILGTAMSGIFYVKLGDGDRVSNVKIAANGIDLISYSANKALRINLNDVPHQKRASKGVKSISAPEADGLNILGPDKSDIIVITNNGYINRFSASGLPLMKRGDKGSKVISLKKNDFIRYIFGVNPSEKLHYYTKEDKNEILISDIPSLSSIAPGTKLIPVKTGDNIISCKIIK